MRRITAQPVVTEMVYLFVAGDVPVVVGIYDQMHRNGMTVETHSTVPTTTTCTRSWAFPKVTRAGLILENKPSIHNVTSHLDLGDDGMPAVGKYFCVHIIVPEYEDGWRNTPRRQYGQARQQYWLPLQT